MTLGYLVAVLAFLSPLAVGCQEPEHPTGVVLVVLTGGMVLDQIRFSASREGGPVGEPQTLPEVPRGLQTQESVYILLPDDLAGSFVRLRAEGLYEAQIVGTGEATAVPALGQTILAEINLVPVGRCGDGVINAGEGCDDGNTGVGDGCGGDCVVEPGYTCLGTPSTCRLSCAEDADCDLLCDVDRGQCVDQGEILFVDCGAGCPGSGSLVEPLCSLQDAVEASADGQHIIVYPGTCSEPLTVVDLRVRIVGIDDPVVEVDTCPAVLVSGGVVTLEGLVIRGSGPASDREGGGLRVRAGAELRLVRSQVLLGECIGIECQDSFCDISRSAVAFNADGGLFMDQSDFRIVNCIIGRNGSSSSSWGGVRIDAPQADPAELINCDVLDNRVDDPMDDVGGVRCDSPATVVNSILWENYGHEVSASCAVSYSNVADPALEGVDGNINEPPMFVDPAGFDFHLDAVTSPCIDKGDPAGVPPAPPEDYEGNPRPLGDGVDLGAFESG